MCCGFVFLKLTIVISFLTLAAFLYSFIRCVEDIRCSGTLSASVCLASRILLSQIFSDRSLNPLPLQVSEKSLRLLFTVLFSTCLFSFPPPTLLYHLPSVLSASFLCMLCPTEALIFYINRLPSATCTSLAFMFLLC